VPDKDLNFDEFDRVNVPAWLGEMAAIITGFCSAESDEEEPLTLEQIRARTHRHEIQGPYAYLWLRVFGELPSPQKAKASLTSTAPAGAPAAHPTEPREGPTKRSNPSAGHGKISSSTKF
jgi:hypothetical protein